MFDESWAIDQKATFMTALLLQAQGLIGLALVVVLAWAASENRGLRPSWRWIGGAVALQIAIAVIIVRVPFIWDVIGLANSAVQAIEKATLAGSSYMFGRSSSDDQVRMHLPRRGAGRLRIMHNVQYARHCVVRDPGASGSFHRLQRVS